MDVKAYHLIAYEVGTDNEVLDWPNVEPTRRFRKGDVIEEGDTQWQVVGVRNTSTQQLWLMEVKKVGKEPCPTCGDKAEVVKMVAEEKWVGLPDNSVKFVSRWFEAACPKCGPFFCLRKVGHHGMIAKKKLKDLFPERERKRLRSALPIGERDLLRQTLNGTREPKDGELERWIRLLNHLRQSS